MVDMCIFYPENRNWQANSVDPIAVSCHTKCMIGLKWARKVIEKGYDSSNRPRNGETQAKVNGKVVTIGHNGSFKKKKWRSSDVYPMNRGREDEKSVP